MIAANYNFDLEKGSDFSLSFIYNNSNGTPIDLSGKCVTFSIQGNDNSIRVYSSKALADYDINGWSLTADNLGIITFKLSAEETNKFLFTTAVYDLDIREPAASSVQNVRLAQGSITLIVKNITLVDILLSGCPMNVDSIIQNPSVPSTSPTPTSTSPTPTVTDITDFCLPYDCGTLDLFSTVYSGSGITITDISEITGSININYTGIISNVEVAINKLNHNNPTDIVLLLAPPSGDKILLSANHKISNFNNNFSFMFSNKADSNKYLHNISNGQTCRIYDKTSTFKYNNENLNSSFDHLFGYSVTGLWSLIVKDTDPIGTGIIDSWKLIITYEDPIS